MSLVQYRTIFLLQLTNPKLLSNPSKHYYIMQSWLILSICFLTNQARPRSKFSGLHKFFNLDQDFWVCTKLLPLAPEISEREREYSTKNIHSDIHQAVWQGLARLADIRKRPFKKNVTRLAKFAQIISKSGEWRASGQYLV